MKLHKVTVFNLNSLYGEHTIDFDNDLKRAPLFLIMGPTGAGKSTILDAICVSLFGRTPRLTRATGKPDMDARHLMSYGTGRCRAEVVFSLKDAEGERHTWRAVWECRRARDKASGNLQDAVRSLYKVIDDETEELIVSDNRIKYFEPHFEEILGGMTVEDFQRSILLAQGEFAAFLKADEQVKASILERLTSTDEYKLIGQRAAKKRREVATKLKELGARLDGLSLLTDEEEKELKQSHAEQEKTVDSSRTLAQQARQARDWVQRYDLLQETLASSKTQVEQAQLTLEEHKEQLDALHEDRRCRDAQPLLMRVQDMTTRHQELTAITPELTQSKLQHVQNLEQQNKIAQEADTKLSQYRKELERLKPEITKARSVKQRIELTQKELKRAQDTHSEVEQKLKTTSEDLTLASAHAEQLATQKQTHTDTLASLNWTTESSQKLATFKNNISKLEDLTQTLKVRSERHQSSLEKLNQSKEKKTSLQAELEEQKTQFEPQQQALNKAQNLLEHLIKGHDSVENYQRALETSQHDASALISKTDDALKLHTELVNISQDLSDNTRELSAHKSTLDAKTEERTELGTQKVTLDTQIQEKQASVSRLERSLVLFEHRHDLDEDHPCPLCGSQSHPYLEEPPNQELEEALREEFSAAQKGLLELQAALKNLQQEMHKLDLAIASEKTSITHLEIRHKELEEDASVTLQSINALLKEMDLKLLTQDETALTTGRDELVALRTNTLNTQTKSTEKLEELQSHIKAHKIAADALQEASNNTSKLEHAIERQDSEITLREEELQDRFNELQSILTKYHEQEGVLNDTLDALSYKHSGSQKLSLEDYKSAEEEFSKLASHYNELTQTLQSIDRDIQQAASKTQKLNDDLERYQARAKELAEEIEQRSHDIDTAVKEQHTLLDGQNPDEVESKLERQIKQTDAALKMATDLQSQARNEFERARAMHEAHIAQIQKLEQDTKEAKQELEHALHELGLKEPSELASRLLEPEQRSHYEELHDKLNRTLDNATRDRDRYQQDLEKHNTQKPEIKELFELTLAEWSDKLHAQEQELEAHIGEFGALSEKLDTQELAKKRAAEYKDELTSLREESNIWETIYRLIGIKDGGSFKHFAQTLNLQELVDRANVRLKRLSPRYQLAVASGDQGEPRLDFSIRDHHQADTERPLTTLSGGETFLVSLALALALSDFRRVDMPVETLLLDEGFGTLDQETLDVAMMTLRQLQQENVQQIGIISHVEGLKERVDTRIIVEKIGNGRSVIKVDAAL